MENLYIHRILNKDTLFFICSKCKLVGDTSHLKNNVVLVREYVFSKNFICYPCLHDLPNDNLVPTEEECYLAAFSDFGFISKFDHIPTEIAVKDASYRFGTKLGKIKDIDEVDITEASMEVSSGLQSFLDEVTEELEGKINISNPLKTTPKEVVRRLKFAEAKRNYRKYKKENNVELMEHYRNVMYRLK